VQPVQLETKAQLAIKVRWVLQVLPEVLVRLDQQGSQVQRVQLVQSVQQVQLARLVQPELLAQKVTQVPQEFRELPEQLELMVLQVNEVTLD
jgi:DNA integrity scanning protein DisA with diadenylate cyclase activity